MGTLLGIGIPLLLVAVLALGIWLVVRAGRRKQARNRALQDFAAAHGLRYVGDDLHGHAEGSVDGRNAWIEFAVVPCSADPSADQTSVVPRMQRVETVLRLTVPGVARRMLVGRPFFRDAIHDPLRGGVTLDVHDPAFEATYRVLAPPGERGEWLEARLRDELTALHARELRLDHETLSLNLDGWDAGDERLTRALRLLNDTAVRLAA